MRRKTWALATAATCVAVIGGAVATSGARQQALAAPGPRANTVKVKRRDLSAMLAIDGILTYRAHADGSLYAVINEARGTYTALPATGQVIAQGDVLYRVNDRPVVLLYGTTPAYRTLSAGMSGPDVAELNADLVTLGYASSTRIGPKSSSFGFSTVMAVKRLQEALGLAQTGTLTLGQAAFEPTAVRVAVLSAQLGGSAQTGELALQGTSTTRQVQVALDASQQTDLALGDKVNITLPDNKTTPGVVFSVGTVAACPSSSSGPGGSTFSSAAPGTDTCSSGATPTITVSVALSDPAATDTWDQAPVQIAVTTASVPNALVVPVNALLAESGGGYAIEIVAVGARNHLVPVSLGLFDDADGLVQVTSSRLTAGQRVVVPTA